MERWIKLNIKVKTRRTKISPEQYEQLLKRKKGKTFLIWKLAGVSSVFLLLLGTAVYAWFEKEALKLKGKSANMNGHVKNAAPNLEDDFGALVLKKIEEWTDEKPHAETKEPQGGKKTAPPPVQETKVVTEEAKQPAHQVEWKNGKTEEKESGKVERREKQHHANRPEEKPDRSKPGHPPVSNPKDQPKPGKEKPANPPGGDGSQNPPQPSQPSHPTLPPPDGGGEKKKGLLDEVGDLLKQLLGLKSEAKSKS
jgi:hypothetical protein